MLLVLFISVILSLPHTFLLISFSFFFITPILFPFLSFLSSFPVSGMGALFSFHFGGEITADLLVNPKQLYGKRAPFAAFGACVCVQNSEKIMRRFSE